MLYNSVDSIYAEKFIIGSVYKSFDRMYILHTELEKVMHSQNSNHESLMLEATALPTAPHLMPRPYTSFFSQKDNIYSGDILLSY